MSREPAQILPVRDQVPAGATGLEIDPYAYIKVGDLYDTRRHVGEQCTGSVGDGLRCLRQVHPDHWLHLTVYRSRVFAIAYPDPKS